MSSDVVGLLVFGLVLVTIEGALHVAARVARRRDRVDTYGVTRGAGIETGAVQPAPALADVDAA